MLLYSFRPALNIPVTVKVCDLGINKPIEFLLGAISVTESPIPVLNIVDNPTPIKTDDASSVNLISPYLMSSSKTEVLTSRSMIIPLILTP